MIKLKNENDIRELKVSGRILSAVLKSLRNEIREGIKLNHLDERARKIIKEAGAAPSFLGYRSRGGGRPFPATICASVNDVVVHGAPGDYALKNGDVVSIDLGVNYRGYFTDAAFTVAVGDVAADARRLIEATEVALRRAINECRAGKTLGDIGAVVEEATKEYKVSVVRGLTGHGVGFDVHEEPTVLNFGRRGEGLKLEPGLVIAVEPMFALGRGEVEQTEDGGYITADGSLSAHFEHTVAVTKNDPLILTA